MLFRSEYVPVCPEVEAGMGIPREPIHLELQGGRLVLLGDETRTEHTDLMTRFAKERVAQLRGMHLSGYIFKSKSPSCGVTLVPGPGLFVQAIQNAIPGLPLIEERDLPSPTLRHQFLERVVSFGRARILRRFV